MRPYQNKIKVDMKKTTSNGRRSQNIQSWIFQQPLIRSSWNFKVKIRERKPKWEIVAMKTTSNRRRHPMEDDLKILKVEYLNNNWLNLLQIWNWAPGDQIKIKIKFFEMKTTSNERWPQNIIIWISLQPLRLRETNQNWKCLK